MKIKMKDKVFRLIVNQKVLLVIVIIITFGIANSMEANAQNVATPTADGSGITPYVAVEEMPMYPGGNNALVSYIGKHIMYPASAMENGIQGKVVIKFCVTANGSVSMISVLKSIDPALDAEAMRIIKTINNFIPGKKDGVPVPVWFMVPITFSLIKG